MFIYLQAQFSQIVTVLSFPSSQYIMHCWTKQKNSIITT